MEIGPAEIRDRYHGSYVNALGKADRALQAYQQIEPRERTYFALVTLLSTEKKRERVGGGGGRSS